MRLAKSRGRIIAYIFAALRSTTMAFTSFQGAKSELAYAQTADLQPPFNSVPAHVVPK